MTKEQIQTLLFEYHTKHHSSHIFWDGIDMLCKKHLADGGTNIGFYDLVSFYDEGQDIPLLFEDEYILRYGKVDEKKTSSSSTDKEAAKFTLKDAVNYYEQKDEKAARIDVSAEVWKKRTYKKMFLEGSIYTTKCEIQRSKK